MKKMTVAQAINEALAEEMALNNEVFVFGEDVAQFGGCFGVTVGLYDKFPDNVFSTPISESGVMGLAAGGAAMGAKMVPELMFSDFVGVAMDSFLNQISKSRYMSGMQEGADELCVVVRLPNGSGLTAAAQHSLCTEALLMNIPGIKIAMPSTPADVKGMLKYAIRGKDPVAFFEHKLLYGVTGEVPDGDYVIPFGEADVKREGSDVTVIATQMMVHKSLAVAEKLAKEDISVEVIDPRTLKPLDINTIVESIKKTGRVVLVNEASTFGNALTEVEAQITEVAFADLKAAPVRVCGPDRPIPFTPVLEKQWIVSEDDIIEGIKKTLK